MKPVELQDGLHIFSVYHQQHIPQIGRVKQIAGGRNYQLILTGIAVTTHLTTFRKWRCLCHRYIDLGKTLSCLGSSVLGSLGLGNVMRANFPEKIQKLKNVKSIVCGGWHAFAICGTVMVFGIADE